MSDRAEPHTRNGDVGTFPHWVKGSPPGEIIARSGSDHSASAPVGALPPEIFGRGLMRPPPAASDDGHMSVWGLNPV